MDPQPFTICCGCVRYRLGTAPDQSQRDPLHKERCQQEAGGREAAGVVGEMGGVAEAAPDTQASWQGLIPSPQVLLSCYGVSTVPFSVWRSMVSEEAPHQHLVE
jgi:hypothetical protein